MSNQQNKLEELRNEVTSLVDVKLEQNSRSVNTILHVYEGVTNKQVEEAIDKAISGLLYANSQLKKAGLKE